MSWWMGAGLGFLRGGPLGALVGGVAQHVITKKARQLIRKGLPGVKDEGIFAACIVVVMTKVAMVKGHITPPEVETIYKFFVKNLKYSTKDLEFVNRIIRETLQVDPALTPVVQKYRESAQSQYRQLPVALAYQIALIQEALTDEAQKEINELARLLDISTAEHDRLRMKYSLGHLVTPYTILGVTEGASNEEIKKAYWKLASQYHPDKVAHLGQSEVEESHLRFLEIQEAYQELEKSRSL